MYFVSRFGIPKSKAVVFVTLPQAKLIDRKGYPTIMTGLSAYHGVPGRWVFEDVMFRVHAMVKGGNCADSSSGSFAGWNPFLGVLDVPSCCRFSTPPCTDSDFSAPNSADSLTCLQNSSLPSTRRWDEHVQTPHDVS